jgi:hypothetical protein
MKYPNLFQIVMEVGPFVGTQDSQGEAQKGPDMDNPVMALVMLGQIVNLGVAVVAPGDAIIGFRGLDLLVLQKPVLAPFLVETRLQKTASSAATIVVAAVGGHVDEILLAHDGFDHETQVFGDGVAVALPDDLAGVLRGKLDFKVLVPGGIGFELAFPDPFRVVFVDVLDFEFVRNVEFFQSGPDRESDVPSLRVQKRFATQLVGLVGGRLNDMFPAVVVGKEHAIVLASPSLGPVSPRGARQMQDLPEGNHLVRLRHGLPGVLV